MEYFSEDAGAMFTPMVDDLNHLSHAPDVSVDVSLDSSLYSAVEEPHYFGHHQQSAQPPAVAVMPSQVVGRPASVTPPKARQAAAKRPATATPHIAKAAAATAAMASSKRYKAAAVPQSGAFPPSPESSSGSPPADSSNESYNESPVSPDAFVPTTSGLPMYPMGVAAQQGAPVSYVAVPITNAQPWGANPVFQTQVDSAQWMQKVAITRLPLHSNPPQEMPAVREVKKSAHNVIERRYRNNINEKIAELRASIPSNANGSSTDDEKMNKGKILKRATDYIRFLRRANDSLRSENDRLREAVRSLGATDLLSSIKIEPGTVDPTTAPQDDDDYEDDDDGQADGSDGSSGSSAQEAGARTATAGGKPERSRGRLGDTSRVLLMACLCLCLAFNPLMLFNGPATSNTASTAAGGRTLSSAISTDADEDGGLLTTVFTLLFRALSALVCLFVLMVGEPVMVADSTELVSATVAHREAEAAMEKGQLSRARRALSDALALFGRPIPVTSFDIYLSLAWNGIRQASHFVPPALYLDRFVANRSAHSRASFVGAADAAVAYLKTQLLTPEDDPSGRSLQSVHAALVAVNLCESIRAPPLQMAQYEQIKSFYGLLMLFVGFTRSPPCSCTRFSTRAAAFFRGTFCALPAPRCCSSPPRSLWPRRRSRGCSRLRALPFTRLAPGCLSSRPALRLTCRRALALTRFRAWRRSSASTFCATPSRRPSRTSRLPMSHASLTRCATRRRRLATRTPTCGCRLAVRSSPWTRTSPRRTRPSSTPPK